MSKFAKCVYTAFDRLIRSHGFRRAWLTSHRHHAALVARPRDEVCYYIFVQDSRAQLCDLKATLWVAPPDLPDAAIDRLGVSYRIVLGATHREDTDFLQKVARRAELLVPGLGGLAAAVCQELDCPAFPGERFYRNILERQALQKIRAFSATTKGTYCRPIFELAAGMADDHLKPALESSRQLDQVLPDIVRRLMAEPHPIEELMEVNEQCGKNPEAVSTLVGYHAYVDALVPPPSQQHCG